MKIAISGILCLVLMLGFSVQTSEAGHKDLKTFEITFQNLTHGVILTPPIFSTSKKRIDVFVLGMPASLGLEMAEEGGATDELTSELNEAGVQDLVQTGALVLPGQSITVTLQGTRNSKLNLASMLLPTNDGFVAVNGARM